MRTQNKRVDAHLLGTTEYRGLQLNGHAGQGVTARLHTRNRTLGSPERTTEERAEHIAHIAHIEASAKPTGIRVVRVDAGIVHAALLGIAQHLVGVVDLFELVLEFRAGDIGMVFTAHLAIGLLDLILACVAVNAQYLVIVCHSTQFLCSFRLLAGNSVTRQGHLPSSSCARNDVRYLATACTAEMVVA